MGCQPTYTDGSLGLQFQNWAQLKALFAELMPGWPAAARSYPTRILGDATSAMVLFTDSPEEFGGEVRAIAPIDLQDGEIIREVDYWDSRHFGERAIGERAHPTIRQVSASLSAAFRAGDAPAATRLFSDDAALDDLTLHTRVIGQLAISGYLQRSLPPLPYGPSTRIRHVVGSAHGGGFEWVSTASPADHGVIALELDQQTRITRLTRRGTAPNWTRPPSPRCWAQRSSNSRGPRHALPIH